MKVSDYIAQFLASRGVTQCFSVTGGFAMHLNDSFGEKLNVVYPHGENPAGYAAIGYSKMNTTPSIVCVTAGCGATNAVTPCLIAYQDSVPVFFISGAVPLQDNVRFRKHSTRTYTGSDCDIIDAVKHMTKFSYELTDPQETPRILRECFQHMIEGRPGPVWLSIPLDIQSKEVFPTSRWNESKRPVIVVGNGIRTSGTVHEFEQFINHHNIPVVTSFFGTDIVPESHIGRVGVIGDRAGNFTIQNADFVLALGCRIGKSITGYRSDWFAREAYVVSVNIEQSDHGTTVLMDLRDFFACKLPEKHTEDWLEKTKHWKTLWHRELPNPGCVDCPYTILHEFFDKKPSGATCVCSSGSIVCAAWHQCVVKQDDRWITTNHGDMGSELPCAIGCAVQTQKPVYCIVGDGSFQFNIQELQTIKSLNLPVKILYFNNGGYGAIQITQDSYFKRRHGVEVPCPDIQKICTAYELPYFTTIDDMLKCEGPCLVELKCIVQQRHPRLSNVMRADGTFDNRPMEDMYPFLERELFRAEMSVKECNV